MTTITFPTSNAEGGRSQAEAPAQAIYEEELHFVRLHPIRRNTPGLAAAAALGQRRGIPPRPEQTTTLAYPRPPTPPLSSDGEEEEEEEEEEGNEQIPSKSTDYYQRRIIRTSQSVSSFCDPSNLQIHSNSREQSKLSDNCTEDEFVSARDGFSDIAQARRFSKHLSKTWNNQSDSNSEKAKSEPNIPTLSQTNLQTSNPKNIDDAATTLTTTATTTTATSSSSRGSSKRQRAKMAANFVSKPIRKSYVGMIAGLASTVGLGQAMFLKATYQSPPDARGPRSGVEHPRGNHDVLASAEGHVTRIIPNETPYKPGNTTSATSASQARVSKAIDDTVRSVGEQLGKLDLSPIVEEHDGNMIKRNRRILIMGDSLVSGVGGESSFKDGPSDGPALPRQVARYLSELLKVDVKWNAISLTGGDVRMLKRKIIPMLTREKERGTIGDISAVILVTGVNDWKRISPIRTANKFREDLEEFISKIREQVGADCPIFLPAIPGVRHSPRFHEPLRSIVIFLNDYWDSQKAQLSRKMRNVYFVGQPPNHEWGSNPVQFFSTLDRVHPSELGYHRWAERIAEHMAIAFQKGVDVATQVTNRANLVASNLVEQSATTIDASNVDMKKVSATVAATASHNQSSQL